MRWALHNNVLENKRKRRTCLIMFYMLLGERAWVLGDL
jgi:hypothetical protein